MSATKRLVMPLLAASLITLGSHAFAAPLATVNGKPISQQDYDAYAQELSQSTGKAPPKDLVMSELLSRELVYQDALQQGVDKDKTVKQQLERIRRNLLVATALDKALAKKKISDKELQALYDEQLKGFDVQEFKARHILVKSKEQAEKLITELDLGGNFANLAKKHSTGPTGKKGGDLGWFAPQQMVPSFAQAVAELKKGKYTKAPVQTKFGWHVILKEDSRKATPPTFEQVKPQLAQRLRQQHLNEYIQSLKKKAKIKVND